MSEVKFVRIRGRIVPIGTKTAPKKTTYHNGDKAEYTGKVESMSGKNFFELKMLEGSKKGKTVFTSKEPGEAISEVQKEHIKIANAARPKFSVPQLDGSGKPIIFKKK